MRYFDILEHEVKEMFEKYFFNQSYVKKLNSNEDNIIVIKDKDTVINDKNSIVTEILNNVQNIWKL